MNILIKIFLTYASISMFSGMLYMIAMMAEIIPLKDIKIGIFIILWFSPVMIAISIGGPILLYEMWMGKL